MTEKEKNLIEQFKQIAAEHEKSQKPCPNCGHCPTCGHTPYRAYPYYPYFPYVTYPYQYGTWCGSSSVTSGIKSYTSGQIREMHQSGNLTFTQ